MRPTPTPIRPPHRRPSAWALLALGLVLGPLLGLGGCSGDAAEPEASSASVAASDAGTRRRALANELPTETVIFTFAAIIDWAEQNHPALFPAGPATQTSGSRVSRTYATGNSIIIDSSNNDILLQGPVVNSLFTPVPFAKVPDFCNAHPSVCPDVQTRAVSIAGVQREYIVYQPWISRAAGNRRLVFMLHGTGQFALDMLRSSGWREIADRDGVVVVFPQALRHCFKEDDNRNGRFENAQQAALLSPPGVSEVHTPTKWAAADLGNPTLMPLCTAAEYRDEVPDSQKANVSAQLADDLGYFDAMLQDLLAHDRINPKTVWVSGFSHGGAMTARLAAERSTVIAAAASTSGVATPGFARAPRGVPFVFTVGQMDEDYTGPLNGGQPLPLTDVALSTDTSGLTVLVTRLVRPFTDPYGLDPTAYAFRNLSVNGKDVALYSFTRSVAAPPQGNVFHLAIMQDMTHVYPNGAADGGHPLEMAEVLWSFFQANPLP